MNTMTSLRDNKFSTSSTVSVDSRWIRMLARLKATSLDERLAAGEVPATARLLAARANLIVARDSRWHLADDWERVLTRARQQIVPRSTRVPLRSATVLAAEHHVRELVAMIREPGGVDARGIALACLLLTDGTGPLYNPRRSAELIPALESARRGGG